MTCFPVLSSTDFLPSPLHSVCDYFTKQTGAQNTEMHFIPLLLRTPSLCSIGSHFCWSTLIAVGHFLYLTFCRERKKKGKIKLSHSSNRNLPELNPGEFFFLFYFFIFAQFSLFSAHEKPVTFQTVRRERWSSYLSVIFYNKLNAQKFQWTCANCWSPPLPRSPGGWHSGYNPPEPRWHQKERLKWQFSLKPSPPFPLNALIPTDPLCSGVLLSPGGGNLWRKIILEKETE